MAQGYLLYTLDNLAVGMEAHGIVSENPLYYSGSQTSKPSNLKPALSAALGSLEVKLDEELARYRRTRISRRTPIQKSLGSLIAAQPQAQNFITAGDSKNQQSLTGEQAVAYIKQQQANSSQSQIKTPPPPPPVPETSPGVAQNQEMKQESKQISTPEEQKIPHNTATTQAQIQPESSQNQSSIVKADMNQNTQNENLPASAGNDNTKQPDDYLESSEALLRSLAEEQPSSKKPTDNNNDSLLSPLSIGSMLLLLLSSMTFGYIVFNLDNLPSLTFGGLFQRNKQVELSENTENTSDSQSAESELKLIPKNPNLASDALPNINNIDDVAGAKPKATPTQAAKPTGVVTSPNTSPTTTVEQMSPTVAENTPATPVSQSETAQAPQNLDEIKPSNGGFYNVIVDNTDDTLSKVRKVVTDAYLSPEGKYIYLGAFKSKQRVKKHLEFLKENGIIARVEQPE